MSTDADHRKRYLDLLLEFTRSEWLLREQSSTLGFLWTLLHPLLMFGVLYGLFTKWMGRFTADYAAFLLIGIVQYNYFTTATNYGLTCLVRRRAILTNFVLPREIIVLGAALSVTASYLIEFLLMLAFIWGAGAKPGALWLLLPVLVAIQVILVSGCALVLSVLSARCRDIERIWGILTTAGFFLTPVFYTLDVISDDRRKILWMNPLTHVIELMRDCILRAHFSGLHELAGLSAAACAAFAFGLWFFRRNERALADYVASF